jgi:hypothetical protein
VVAAAREREASIAQEAAGRWAEAIETNAHDLTLVFSDVDDAGQPPR